MGSFTDGVRDPNPESRIPDPVSEVPYSDHP
jgi:hypothetical protein